MAGLYPDEQTVTVFGKKVSFPGLDPKTGKFTNGSFSDPAVRPSFIPAQTINLVLDILAECVSGLGGTPDNTDARQLIKAITACLAPLASPKLTGTPEAPTAKAGTSNNQIATTAFVKAAVDALISGSAAALDTLKELADALGNDPNFAATMTQALAGKVPANHASTGTDYGVGNDTTYGHLKLNTSTAPQMAGAASAGSSGKAAQADHRHPTDTTRAPLASPALTGTPTAPTAAAATNNTQIATTAFVQAQKASPVFTGTPQVPGKTGIPGTSGTLIATEAQATKGGHPVGSYYAQYPASAANDYDAAFPAAERPAALFGGTWSPVWESDQVVFKTGGTVSTDLYTPARSSGLQAHGVPNITGYFGSEGERTTIRVSGAFYDGGTFSNTATPMNVDSSPATLFQFNASRCSALFGASSGVVMRNRKMIVWKRTG
ncbi:MAG: phage tail protein [Treponematales bacterium]